MNKLTHLKQFQEILKNYQPNARALRVLRGTKIVLLVAPTSSGRNTIIKEMIKAKDYHFLVSDTTRQPRVDDNHQEVNGVDYWFRSEPEMLDDLRAGEFVAASIIHNQQVSGISIREIQVALVKRSIPITDVEVKGASSIHRLHPQATCIFVVPPSYDEWQRRLVHRGKMEKEEYERRMASAKKELTVALQAGYYHFIVNDDYKESVDVIRKLVDGDFQQSLRKNARSVAEGILKRLE